MAELQAAQQSLHSAPCPSADLRLATDFRQRSRRIAPQIGACV